MRGGRMGIGFTNAAGEYKRFSIKYPQSIFGAKVRLQFGVWFRCSESMPALRGFPIVLRAHVHATGFSQSGVGCRDQDPARLGCGTARQTCL